MPLWVLSGAVLGVATGLFFGDVVAPVGDVNRLYASLMQIAALPYLLSSLLHGLAVITRAEFGRILRCGGLAYGILLLITFSYLLVLTIAVGAQRPPALIDGSVQSGIVPLLDRTIPDNIFEAATQNYLPAVVVFSVLYGIAAQSAPKKQSFVDVLSVVKSASVRIWQWIVMFAPLAVFSVTAELSATSSLENLISLSTYVVAMLGGAAVLSLVVLPAVMESISPRAMRAVWPDLRNGILLSLTTSLSVVALPFIHRALERYFDEIGQRPEDERAISETIISLSYPLAQLGNFFIWVFVVFAAQYYRIEISSNELTLLPFAVFLSGVGSPSTSIDAVSFLVDWLNLPTRAFDLYTGLFTITRYGQVMASVVGFMFMAVVVSAFSLGVARFSVRNAVRFLVPALCLVAATAVTLQYVTPAGRGVAYFHFPQLKVSPVAGVDVMFASDGACTPAPTAQPAADQRAERNMSALEKIRRRGMLRVGYNPAIIPFSYRNEDKELVGFDVEYMYRLAASLSVNICFVEYAWDDVDKILSEDTVDIVISGVYVDDERLRNSLVSDPYFEDRVVLIARPEKADQYLTKQSVLNHPDKNMTVFKDPFMLKLARSLLPGYDVKEISTYYGGPEFDLGLWTREQAWAFAMTSGNHTAVIVKDFGGKVLFAYLMQRDARALGNYVNYWLRLQRDNGVFDTLSDKWLKANPTLKRDEHWSILHNVLGVDWP